MFRLSGYVVGLTAFGIKGKSSDSGYPSDCCFMVVRFFGLCRLPGLRF